MPKSGGNWSLISSDLVKSTPVGKVPDGSLYLLFYGLAVRTPLFPLHGWLPNMAHSMA